MKKALYTALFFCSLLSISISQTSLTGNVTDSESGEPILFATVVIYKDNVLITGTETDLDGKYLFSDIVPGTYDVEVSYMGTPERKKNVVIEAGKVNRLDFTILDDGIIEEAEIIDFKTSKKVKNTTTTGTPVTSGDISKLPSKKINAIATSISGVSSDGPKDLSMRSKRDGSAEYYVDGIRTATFGAPATSAPMRTELPSSGQMTAGEWNDLHNWKDWLALLEDESYSIMTERFEIFPIERYHVLVLNKENAVMVNVPVQLLDQKGAILWETFTDNSGVAELWENAIDKSQSGFSIKVRGQVKEDIVKISEGSNTFILEEECYSPSQMDIVFTVDATSSMNDEISYLKSELMDVMDRIKETNEDVDFNLGSVFYRDTKDEYLTRISPLSPNIEETINFVSNQNSSGGGDNPEAVDAALEETLNLSWRKDALKVVFLILDAPPHEDYATMDKIRSQIKEAANRGIKIIPVTASGIGRETEFLMKFMAILTNGTYVFITDDSGIGNPHLDPVVDDYEVEKLNDCLVRLITQYSKSYSCDAPLEAVSPDLDVSVFPNPAAQYITVKANSIPDKIRMYSANGMMVHTITPTEKNTRIELTDFVNGIYTITIHSGDKIESKQIILLN